MTPVNTLLDFEEYVKKATKKAIESENLVNK
jgi:hypothetical protein